MFGYIGSKLGNRIGDIKYWKGELDHETGAIISETELLNRAIRFLETFLKESDNQIHIANECLYQREKRQGRTGLSSCPLWIRRTCVPIMLNICDQNPVLCSQQMVKICLAILSLEASNIVLLAYAYNSQLTTRPFGYSRYLAS